MGAPPPAGRVGMDPWWAVVGGGGERPQVRKDGVAGDTKGWAAARQPPVRAGGQGGGGGGGVAITSGEER